MAGGSVIELSGSRFNHIVACRLGNSSTASSKVDANRIICRAPPAQHAGIVSIELVSKTDLNFAISGFTFAYVALSLSSASPSSGPTHGGTLVRLSGVAMLPSICVHDDGSAWTSRYESRTLIVCKSPGRPQAGRSFIHFGGLSQGKWNYPPIMFNYYVEPQVATIAPSHGPAFGGTDVTLWGTGVLQTPSRCPISSHSPTPSIAFSRPTRFPLGFHASVSMSPS